MPMVVRSSWRKVLVGCALPWLGLGLGPGACTGSETGNPSVSNLALTLRTSDESVASVGADGMGIRVQELWLAVDSLAFSSCDASATEVVVEQAGALVGDLARGIDASGPPAGQYCGVHLKLVASQLPSVPTSVPAGEASLAAYGLRTDDVPFAVLSGAPLDISVPGVAFDVGEHDALLLAFDVAGWLRAGVLDTATLMSGTAVLDGRLHPALTTTFESQITVGLYRDSNGNGQVDATEPAIATLH